MSINKSVQVKELKREELEIIAESIVQDPVINRSGKDRSVIRRALTELINRLYSDLK